MISQGTREKAWTGDWYRRLSLQREPRLAGGAAVAQRGGSKSSNSRGGAPPSWVVWVSGKFRVVAGSWLLGGLQLWVPRPSVRLEPGSVPVCSGGAGRMSAEAADREAATSSRPCTPPQTCWFEFLLEESLLEKHLRKPCPGMRGSCCPRGAKPGYRRCQPGSHDPAPSWLRSRGPGGNGPEPRAHLWPGPLAKH